MKIACLQFAPTVGDVDNNLNLADAVLDRASLDELSSLDLLVLPELAFTGYNFKSLPHISPFFENAGSGISALWAQTTALKYDCVVVVGYPEKPDVTAAGPASPEHYSSALVVDGEGDVIANYRKSFLYHTDESWALEGAGGFFQADIPFLGNVALGICTDLNPYKLEAPWDDFELGYHILDAQANLVILTMAWQTHQDATLFRRSPKEPDLETLVYWVQRLEPLIREESDDEIVVVFCNRTGTEDEATYTGTSAVIGIKYGEVFVYGILGRQESGLLVVDTDRPPMSKLANVDAGEADSVSTAEAILGTANGKQSPKAETNDMALRESHASQSRPAGPGDGTGPDTPRTPASPRLPWLALPGGLQNETPSDNRSPTRLTIPTISHLNMPHLNHYQSMDSAVTDIVDSPHSPDFPGSARRPSRPKLSIPASTSVLSHKPSPFPYDRSRSAVFGRGATMTPITPFDEDGWSSTPLNLTPIDPKPSQWFWKHEPTLSALAEAIEEEEEEEEENEKESVSEPSEPQAQPPMREATQDVISPAHEHIADDETHPTEKETDLPQDAPDDDPPQGASPSSDWADLRHVLESLKLRPDPASDPAPSHPDRPGSTKSWNFARNASRPRDDTTNHASRAQSTPRAAVHRRSTPSGSPDSAANGDGNGSRRPRPRHAPVFFCYSDDDDNSDDESDREGDQQLVEKYTRPRSVSRGRQPARRPLHDGVWAEERCSPRAAAAAAVMAQTSDDTRQPPPTGTGARNRRQLALSLETIARARARRTASPSSLCSAASSVSAFGDGDDELATPKMGAAFAAAELVIGFDQGLELDLAMSPAGGKRGLWLGSQTGYYHA